MERYRVQKKVWPYVHCISFAFFRIVVTYKIVIRSCSEKMGSTTSEIASVLAGIAALKKC